VHGTCTITSGRTCKSKSFRLCQEEGLFEGDQNILDYATGFIRPADLLPVSLSIPLPADLHEVDKSFTYSTFLFGRK
jgi:hypothetical protein